MARNHDMSGIMDWWRRKSQPKQPAGPPPPAHMDLYDVLRVPMDASQDDIRRAFRELALKFHPDRNPGDPTADRKYAEIATAYSILGDEVQRAAYDRLRAASAPPPPPPPIRHGLIPRPGRGPEETQVQEKPASPLVPSKPQPTMWELMFGKPEEGEVPTGSIFEVFAKESPPPPMIPSAQSPYGWATPFQKKVPLTPQIDTPTQQEIYQILQEWPLDGIWELVRHVRHSEMFHKAKAKALAIDTLAGAGQQPAEWDLAEMFGIPTRQVDEFVHHRGRQAFFGEILYPLFDQITQIMGQIKPVDLPGQFFLDWDQTGRMIELIYSESVGRRPWE